MKIAIELNERDEERLKIAATRMGFRQLDKFVLGCVQARLRQIEKDGTLCSGAEEEREDG